MGDYKKSAKKKSAHTLNTESEEIAGRVNERECTVYTNGKKTDCIVRIALCPAFPKSYNGNKYKIICISLGFS